MRTAIVSGRLKKGDHGRWLLGSRELGSQVSVEIRCGDIWLMGTLLMDGDDRCLFRPLGSEFTEEIQEGTLARLPVIH